MCIILPAHVGYILHTQGCSCMCMILPKNPNLNFSNSVSYFTCNAFVLDPFFIYIHIYIYIYIFFFCLSFRSIICLFVCLFVFHMLN